MEERSSKYVDLVKDKIYFVLKDDLMNFAANKGIIPATKKSCTKDFVISSIKEKLDHEMAAEIIEAFKDKIGFTSSEVEDILKITKTERVKWTKKDILCVTGFYEVRAYGSYLDCPVYSANQILGLAEKGVEHIRETLKKPSDKQLAAIERARKKSIENRTCKKCGRIVGSKKKLHGDLCEWCYDIECKAKERRKALLRRKYWIDNKEDFCILDVETTGLNSNDQIVEIAIIDLTGKVLINTLVKPSKAIPKSATAIHGIKDEDVKNVPTWNVIWLKVKKILEGKTIIAYNSSFDTRMMDQSNYIHKIDRASFKHECLMYNTMDVVGTDRWISLKDALGYENIYADQDHRALGDCRLCLDLIKESLINFKDEK